MTNANVSPIRVLPGRELEEDGEGEGVHDDDLLVEAAAVQLHDVRVWRSEG